MILVTFFLGEISTDKQYTGESAALCAMLDMDQHIRNGGWCMAEYNNVAVMITNLQQLGL